MSKHMLIDAAHPEQTRVAVVDGNRVEEFDFESRSKKQLRGNIYLAKVTRVEASLQAAFVEYGGNRHGFLSFNEIHPDYYQIPVKDREKLLKLEEEEERAAELAEARRQEAQEHEEAAEAEDGDAQALSAEAEPGEESDFEDEDTDAAEEAAIAEEAAARRRQNRTRAFRHYKIQEVIKPGQVLLVQVSKEERGTKGAALTTYLSLAGRYCVLMPNTARGGGISRKISNAADRKRLKSIIADLGLPKGVGLIIRTAGSKRTKAEIRRDYEYLGRLWSLIREKTLASIAPTLVHEEGGLVRRAVRDLYDKDIEAVYVEGAEAYREAHDFMKMLMPSHASRVKHYKEAFPIFLKYKVEEQLEAIYSPTVRLKSGGYLVIHQTEALVAIDVNSGRSTRERNIEATALKTNLEAAEEACRQMRLRDLAGLIVIDFIDMDESKNNRAVEKRMKEALKRDRARIQMGRISPFGLMELSRQRRRASVIEGSSQVCPTCAGLGVIRSVESAALSALQGVEAEVMNGRVKRARLTAPTPVALYLLNEKRDFITTMENELDMHLVIAASADLMPPQFEIEVLEKHEGKGGGKRAQKSLEDKSSGAAQAPQESAGEAAESPESASEEKAEAPKKRRRGRRGGRGRRKAAAETAAQSETLAPDAGDLAPDTEAQGDAGSDASGSSDASDTSDAKAEAAPRRRRRRRSKTAGAVAETEAGAAPEAASAAPADGATPEAAAKQEPVSADTVRDSGSEATETPKRRPVRRRRSAASRKAVPEDAAPQAQDADKTPTQDAAAEPAPAPSVTAGDEATETPKRRPVRRRRPGGAKASGTSAAQPAAPAVAEPQDKPETEQAAQPEPEAPQAPRPRRRPARRKAAKAEADAAQAPADAPTPDAEPASPPAEPAPQAEPAPAEQETGKPGRKKKGWWARKFST